MRPTKAATQPRRGSLAVFVTGSAIAALAAPALACEAEDDPLAREVPASGRSSPIFAELDIAARQLVKWRCVGAGVLAVSYRGHRVYSRGFGKLRGSATPSEHRPGPNDRCRDEWDPEAPITPPETPMRIGSVTKGVVAAIVRPLVAERIDTRAPGAYEDEFDAPLLDPQLDLLPASLRRYFHHPESCPEELGQSCVPPPLASPGTSPPPEVSALCDPRAGADRRWPAVTIGHLLTHRSGLARANAQWPEVIPEHFSELRGYNGRRDLEVAHELSRESFGAEPLEHARTLTARALGVESDAVYFIGHHDQRDLMPVDQQLKVLAGRCLKRWPGEGIAYSNTGHALLGRVVDHLWSDAHGADPRYSFAGRPGRPEEHQRSALATFIRDELELDGGVESQHGLYGHQWYFPRGSAEETGEPEFRRWEDGTYTPRWAPNYHFYCVWRGDRCDTSSWEIETLRWRWDLVQGSVPHWAGMNSDHYASGGLMGEASMMLELVNRFQIGRGVASGTRRSGWRIGTNNGGSITGGRAFLGRHGGVSNKVKLPPLDAEGRLTDDFIHLQERTIKPERGVAFFFAVNQQDDARCGAECDEAYAALEDVLRYTLTRIDWDDVRHLIDSRHRRVVGLVSDPQGRPIAWYADSSLGLGEAWTGLGDLPRVDTVDLPSTRIGDDVLGIALAPDGTLTALFSDGRASLGTLDALPQLGDARPRPFVLPAGVDPSMIVAVAADLDGTLVTWLRDQQWLRGDLDDLAAIERGTYRLPPERSSEELADATFDAAGRVRALFDDGAIATGSPEDLQNLSTEAPVAGVTDAGGALFVVHRNGYLRALQPSSLGQTPVGVGWIALETPPEPNASHTPAVHPEDVVAIATDDTVTHVWLRGGHGRRGRLRLLTDEERAQGMVDADLYAEEFTWLGDEAQIIDVAFIGGRALAWRRDGALIDVSEHDLRGDNPRPFTLPPGRSIDELVGVTVDADGTAYARYTDGLWSRGSAEDLGSIAP